MKPFRRWRWPKRKLMAYVVLALFLLTLGRCALHMVKEGL